MLRNWKPYLRDMRVFATRCLAYVNGKEAEEFFSDQMRLDAVLRNLELLGEAAKRLPEEFRLRHPVVP